MKKPLTVLFAMSLGLLTTASTCNGRQVAKTVLDVAEMSCVLFHDEVEDEKVLATLCGIAEELIPDIRKVVFARKSAVARKAAAASASASAASSKGK